MRIAFYSTMSSLPWGGSEELWSRAALLLQERGHDVAFSYRWWPDVPARLAEIQRLGGRAFWRRRPPFRSPALESFAPRAFPLLRVHDALRSWRWLEIFRPDLVVIAVGWHVDSLAVAARCRRIGIPYAINLQVASEYSWIPDERLTEFREAYGGARACLLVSEDNRAIMETQLAMLLRNVEIVDNPFNVAFAANPPWQEPSPLWRLACVGRLNFDSKAQDLIVRVLAMEKWRRRPIQVCFWGVGQGSEERLLALIAMHGLEGKAVVRGFSEDIEGLWGEHHAMLLPSRYEGAALVTVEALLCGRIAIVTRCGRNEEFVDDGETGFLIEAPTLEKVDEALERAWTQRRAWQAMGRAAAERVRARISPRPEEDFADRLERLARADGDGQVPSSR